MGYTRAYCNRLISNYIEEIEFQIKYIEKNFTQMDFENAVARDECEAIVVNMIKQCNDLINQLDEYNFS